MATCESDVKDVTFRNAKVGDRVWSPQLGWGEIIRTESYGHYPIRVKPDAVPGLADSCCTFTTDGKISDANDIPQSLFWAPCNVLDRASYPERPKRKVKKSKTLWGRCFTDGDVSPDNLTSWSLHGFGMHPRLFETEEAASRHNVDRKHQSKPFPITFEWEEEE